MNTNTEETNNNRDTNDSIKFENRNYNHFKSYIIVPFDELNLFETLNVDDVYKNRIHTSYLEAYETFCEMPEEVKKHYTVIGVYIMPIMMVIDEKTAKEFDGRSDEFNQESST